MVNFLSDVECYDCRRQTCIYFNTRCRRGICVAKTLCQDCIGKKSLFPCECYADDLINSIMSISKTIKELKDDIKEMKENMKQKNNVE